MRRCNDASGKLMSMCRGVCSLTASVAQPRVEQTAIARIFRSLKDIATSGQALRAVHDLRRREREREGRRRDAHRQGDDAVQARRHREARREGRRRARACTTRSTVLPVSQFDDELRYRIARAIYSNSNFWNYAIMAEPADPHRRRARPRDADGRRAERRGSDAGAIAGDAVRRVVGDERPEDGRRGP